MGKTLLNLRVLGVDSSKILKFKAQEFLFELERKKDGSDGSDGSDGKSSDFG